MKKFTYKWKIYDHYFTGTYICEDEAALKSHVAKYNGELLEVLQAEDAVVEQHVVQEAPKPAVETKVVNICPKCMTEYDETFKVCYKCNFTPLEHKAISADERYWEEFRNGQAAAARPSKARGWLVVTAIGMVLAVAIGFFGWEFLRPSEWKRYHLGWSGFSLESPRPLKKVTSSAGASGNPAIQEIEIYKTGGKGDFAMIFSSIIYASGITASIDREGMAAIVEMQKSFESQGCTDFQYVSTPITKSDKTGILFSGSFLHPLKIREEFQCIVLVDSSKLWFLFTLYSGPNGATIAKRIIDSIRIDAPKLKKAPKAKP